MIKVFLGVIFLLSGCAAHRIPVQSDVTEQFILTGSPCVDGVLTNIQTRCEQVVSSDSEYGEYFTLTCVDPLPIAWYDTYAVYSGYTQFTFRIYSNDNEEYIPYEGIAFLCQDSSFAVGFEIPTE